MSAGLPVQDDLMTSRGAASCLNDSFGSDVPDVSQALTNIQLQVLVHLHRYMTSAWEYILHTVVILSVHIRCTGVLRMLDGLLAQHDCYQHVCAAGLV